MQRTAHRLSEARRVAARLSNDVIALGARWRGASSTQGAGVHGGCAERDEAHVFGPCAPSQGAQMAATLPPHADLTVALPRERPRWAGTARRGAGTARG